MSSPQPTALTLFEKITPLCVCVCVTLFCVVCCFDPRARKFRNVATMHVDIYHVLIRNSEWSNVCLFVCWNKTWEAILHVIEHYSFRFCPKCDHPPKTSKFWGVGHLVVQNFHRSATNSYKFWALQCQLAIPLEHERHGCELWRRLLPCHSDSSWLLLPAAYKCSPAPFDASCFFDLVSRTRLEFARVSRSFWGGSEQSTLAGMVAIWNTKQSQLQTLLLTLPVDNINSRTSTLTGGKVAKPNQFSSAYQSANIQMFCTGKVPQFIFTPSCWD